MCQVTRDILTKAIGSRKVLGAIYKHLLIFKNFFLVVYLIYNVVLLSGVQHTD